MLCRNKTDSAWDVDVDRMYEAKASMLASPKHPVFINSLPVRLLVTAPRILYYSEAVSLYEILTPVGHL